MSNILRSTLSTLSLEPCVFSMDFSDGQFFIVSEVGAVQTIKNFLHSDYTSSVYETGITIGSTIQALWYDGSTYLWAVIYNSSTGAQNLFQINNTTGLVTQTVLLSTYLFTQSDTNNIGVTGDGTNIWVLIPPGNVTKVDTPVLHKVVISGYTHTSMDLATATNASGLSYNDGYLWYLDINPGTDCTLTGIDPSDPTNAGLQKSIVPGSFLPSATSVYFKPTTRPFLVDTSYYYVCGYDYSSLGPDVVGTFCFTKVLRSDLTTVENIRIPYCTGAHEAVSIIETINSMFVVKVDNHYLSLYRLNLTCKQTISGADATKDYVQEVCPLISEDHKPYFVHYIDANTYNIIRASNSLQANLRTELALTITPTHQIITLEETETDVALDPLKSSVHDFSFNASSGTTYVFTVDSSVVTGALWDTTDSPNMKPFISIWDTEENEIAISGTGSDVLAKTLTWIAPSTATYHVRVRTQE